jgi:hypothetical protein
MLFLAANLLSGVLWGFYTWGARVAVLVILAYAVWQTFWGTWGRKQPVHPLRRVLAFVLGLIVGVVGVWAGLFVGIAAHGGVPS